MLRPARASRSAQSTTIFRPNRRCCSRSSGVKRNRCLRAGGRSSTTRRATRSRPRVAFTEIFLDDFTRDDRRLWRELFGAAIAEPSAVGRRLFEGDTQLVSQLASLLEHYRTCGVLASDLEPIPAATVLYGVCFTWMTAYLMNDAISAEMVRNEIRRGTAIAMRGLFPRTGAISITTRGHGL